MKSRKISSDDRIVLLGSSRGLGWATYNQLISQSSDSSYFLASRKIKTRENEVSKNTVLAAQDFSKTPLDLSFLTQLKNFTPTRIIYFAGGGPHGVFEEKKWSDHQWAFNTSFLYPAELVHSILSDQSHWLGLRQIILIGSSVAENKADPLAASYAAAKHALRGMVDSMAQEASEKPIVQLFSPGYMQTDLLPAHSQPRQNGLAEDPVQVAKKLIAFIEKND
ncbi:MAG: SDR family NAD(P)-dependent oxidoreductase [Bdellovibrio sp.]|nr:SDR family NAD(P)-dependent oxidoreductase [Bdellovibrio sp.]